MKIKSPLRYPGGKSKAIKYLMPFLPQDINELREPMLGGGSVALHMKQSNPNIKLWLNDSYYNLYCFWKVLQETPVQLRDKLLSVKNTCETEEEHRELFFKTKDLINTTQSEFQRAYSFFILNKCSFGGLTEVGTYSKTAALGRFTISTINKLMGVSQLIRDSRITNNDYSVLLREPGENVFIFLDPPYDILKNKKDYLYKNHNEFDHLRFYDEVCKCDHRLVITYNKSQIIEKRYCVFDQKVLHLEYGLHHKREGDGSLSGNGKDELLIMKGF